MTNILGAFNNSCIAIFEKAKLVNERLKTDRFPIQPARSNFRFF